MKAVYCVFKETDTYEVHYELVQIFARKADADAYLARVKDKGLYKVSLRKVY